MTVIFAISIVTAVVFIAAVAFVAGRVDVESTGTPLGSMFMFQRPLDRPRGVQEEDLPPFVFRNEPAASVTQ